MNTHMLGKGALDSISVETIELLAYLYLQNNRSLKTIALLQVVTDLQCATARGQATLALAQLRAGRAESAIQTLQQLKQLNSDFPIRHLILAQALCVLNRKQEAEQAMQLYIKERKSN